jgi:hypothetical protein
MATFYKGGLVERFDPHPSMHGNFGIIIARYGAQSMPYVVGMDDFNTQRQGVLKLKPAPKSVVGVNGIYKELAEEIAVEVGYLNKGDVKSCRLFKDQNTFSEDLERMVRSSEVYTPRESPFRPIRPLSDG